MEHFLQTRWRIPGRFSDYVILRGSSRRVERSGQQVAEVHALPLLEGWLVSGPSRTLHDIYEALGGSLPLGLNVFERVRYDQRLKERLRDAFLFGELVVLELKHPLPTAWPIAPVKPPPKPAEPEPEQEPERTFVVIRLVDDDGNPVPGARYRVELPDGSVREGTLNSRGEARENYVVPGECKVTFPELEDTDWKPGNASEKGKA